jgi:hypothetical protein
VRKTEGGDEEAEGRLGCGRGEEGLFVGAVGSVCRKLLEVR